MGNVCEEIDSLLVFWLSGEVSSFREVEGEQKRFCKTDDILWKTFPSESIQYQFSISLKRQVYEKIPKGLLGLTQEMASMFCFSSWEMLSKQVKNMNFINSMYGLLIKHLMLHTENYFKNPLLMQSISLRNK